MAKLAAITFLAELKTKVKGKVKEIK